MLWLSFVWVAPGHAASATPIFVLHSYSQEYPWTKRQHDAYLRTLGTALRDPLDVSVEYLDSKRTPYSAAYADFFAGYLARKYAGFEPKLIYVTDDNALLFALTHLTRIFPKVPIFFSGINDYGMRQRIDPRQVTGVFENKEIAPNLELMRHLAPGVHDILVVGDESETYQAIRREINAELARQPEIQARFLSSGRIEKLVASLQGRKERFVFLTTLGAMTNAAGRTLTLPETMAAIVQAGQFIIISMEDVYLYPGVLGGYVTSGYKQGAAAAAMSARYLSGTAMTAIKPIESSPNEYIIDGAELEKLGLTLPAGIAGRVTLLNQPQTFYERNFDLIVRALYVFALLFVVSLAISIYVLMRKNRQIARTSKELVAQTEQLRTVIESFPVVLWTIDCEGVFQLSRGAGLKALGLAPDEVVGKSLFEIYRDFPAIIAETRRALAGESCTSSVWIGAVAFETYYSPLRDRSGAVIGAIGVASDVTSRVQAEERIRHLASYDELTGLPNRSMFHERLQHALAQAQRNARQLAVLFIDLDRFKNINDTLGHEAGDQVLKEVAERLRGCLRDSDNVGRLGGDEFVVLIEELPQVPNAAAVAQKILDAVAKPFVLAGAGIPPRREHRHQHLPRRRQGPAEPAEKRGHRDVPRQGTGQEQLSVLLGADEHRCARTPGAGIRPAPRAGAQ